MTYKEQREADMKLEEEMEEKFGLSAYDILKIPECPLKLPHARSMTQATIDYYSALSGIYEWYEDFLKDQEGYTKVEISFPQIVIQSKTVLVKKSEVEEIEQVGRANFIWSHMTELEQEHTLGAKFVEGFEEMNLCPIEPIELQTT